MLAIIPFIPFQYARMQASLPAHLNWPFASQREEPSAFCADADEAPRAPMCFNIGSYPILVDNGASHLFTNYKANYVAPPKPFHWHVVGIKTSQASHIRTVQWSWAYDNGRIITELISNVLLCRDMPYHMLSPQQWARSRQDFKPHRDGTRCVTDADPVVLEWDQQMRRRTIQTPKIHSFLCPP
jgi:hypothetical protein